MYMPTEKQPFVNDFKGQKLSYLLFPTSQSTLINRLKNIVKSLFLLLPRFIPDHVTYFVNKKITSLSTYQPYNF